MRLIHSNPNPLSSARPPTLEAELRHLSARELARLRSALGAGLSTLELGTPASRLVGRLAHAARTEQRRRRLPSDGTPRAAA